MNKIFFLACSLILVTGAWNTSHALPHARAQNPAGPAAAKTAAVENNDDENVDAISRWSGEDGERKKTGKVEILPAPILESSFEKNSNRAPASVEKTAENDGNSGRSPAMVDVSEVKLKRKGVAPAKAVVRAIKKRKAYQEAAVIANEQGFFPSTVFVTQGIPVKLYVTGASPRSQCFMIDSLGVRRQIKNQKIEEIVFTPDESGTFSFGCPMNGAKGVLVVKELDLGVREPASVVEEVHATQSASAPAKNNGIKPEDFGAGFNDE